MTNLVVGASGATGRLLVAQLLDGGQSVTAIVRSRDSLPKAIRHHDGLTLIHASVLDLSDEDQVTEYEVHPSSTRSAIFNAGATSRLNVAHFMADLITDSDTWNRWKGKMPVIYNKALS
jgi:nucleoside-diphosphate-sugar epimerase